MTITYIFDPARSLCAVQAFATGLLSAFGHSPTFAVRDLAGELVLASSPSDLARVQVTIPTGSLQLQDAVPEKDREDIEGRMRNEVLEVQRYPQTSYQGTIDAASPVGENRYRLRINGRLTLRGVTNQQSMDAALVVTGDDMRLTGEFSLSQSRYGIRPVTALAGAIRLKDEVKFAFDVGGRKREGA
jgi:polyisoprenoid-binding protein YceI